MSATGREVAHRLFAAEYEDATYSYSESDEEMAPNYVVTPTGARVNRLLFVGVLTEVEEVSSEVLRARVVDPTGAFVVYAGQYQPEALAFLERAEPPTFVAVTGKARTFSPDDSDRVFTSVRPESITTVDAETRDRWTVEAAEATLARVATFAAAIETGLSGDALRSALTDSGVPEGLAAGIPIALAEYGTTEHYLAGMADVALDALALVAGSADEVGTPSVTPGTSGDGTVDVDAIVRAVGGAVIDLEVPDSAGSDTETPPDDGDRGDPDGAADEGSPPATASTGSGSGEDGGQREPADATADSDSTAASAGESTDELGDFEPGATAADETTAGEPAAEEASDSESAGAASTGPAADDGAGDGAQDDVLGDEERERIEAEYGTDFSTGGEVGEPGDAGIEPEAGPIDPEAGASGGTSPSDGSEAGGDDGSGGATESDESGGATESAESTESDGSTGEGGTESPDPPDDADEVDLEAAVMDAMDDLDEGDGADREAVVAVVVEAHGVDPGAVQDAIQDALMAGKCYEPDDETVKPI